MHFNFFYKHTFKLIEKKINLLQSVYNLLEFYFVFFYNIIIIIINWTNLLTGNKKKIYFIYKLYKYYKKQF
jgi:hypothetical protein